MQVLHQNTKINGFALSWFANPNRVALGLAFGGISLLFGISMIVSDLETPNLVSATEDAKDVPVNINVDPAISIKVADSTGSEIDNLTMNVIPTGEGSSLAKSSAIVSVATNNLTGYQLLLSMADDSTTTSLDHTLEPTSYQIPSVATNTPISSTDLIDHWGYSLESPTSITTISPLPAIGTTAELKNIDHIPNPTNPEETDTNFTIGTRVSMATPSGSYANAVKFTAITNAPPPEPIRCTSPIPNGPTYMQDFTPTTKDLMTEDAQYVVKDKRDNTPYCIAKLQDGNVWMTQNLDLDITTEGLTNELTDLNSQTAWNASSQYAPQATETTTSSSSTYTDTRSWSLGEFYYDPGVNASCGSSAHSYADCAKGFLTTADPNSDQHYHVGNLYQYNTATAGSGASVATSGAQAPDSICPKGWRLPQGGTTPNAFSDMLSKYDAWTSGTSGTVQNLIKEPIYMVRGGYVSSGTLGYAAYSGGYWSSTSSSSSSAYSLILGGNRDVGPANNSTRYYGRSLRCIAR